ncbi:MAG: hypothetical protein KO217_03865 [Methanobacteriaceae archaeon]|jgi:hypothetical protein|nr:MAG: hypothetical protein CIT01_04980 [Methanobacterium sp. BRmetb2]MCC7557808.1 hypothetical protein [Methanobacteriaceae archaeon]
MSKNISEERMQILEMVEEGKINTKEAMELLDALEGNQEEITPKKDAKWLKVRVRTMDDNPKVNVNIPISLVDVGLKMAKKFDPKLKESGLDKIDLDEIIEAVKNGAEGKIVDVEDEENQTKVKIYVE